MRAKAAAGETDAAAAHLSELRSIAEAVGTRPLHATARLCEGLVAAAAGDDQTARAELEEAVDLFATSGAAFELARARLALARVLAASGREDAAARQAVLALERLDEIGATAEAARARELVGDLGARAAPTPAVPCDELLTRRQLEVVRLVSQGLTDAQIAKRLVLSRHTVHRHLQNAYARLGCSSRAAAVAEAHRLKLL